LLWLGCSMMPQFAALLFIKSGQSLAVSGAALIPIPSPSFAGIGKARSNTFASHIDVCRERKAWATMPSRHLDPLLDVLITTPRRHQDANRLQAALVAGEHDGDGCGIHKDWPAGFEPASFAFRFPQSRPWAATSRYRSTGLRRNALPGSWASEPLPLSYGLKMNRIEE
jgi:hypothetical protein